MHIMYVCKSFWRQWPIKNPDLPRDMVTVRKISFIYLHSA